MALYKVRSGQNIYDIAFTLYGSVEGIFSLLVLNDWLTLDTKLEYGMELQYDEKLEIHNDITIWLRENNIRVKNGNHKLSAIDLENLIYSHFEEHHKDRLENLSSLSSDEQTMFWETFYRPKMVISQQGQLTSMGVALVPETHLIIDWGDYSEPQIIEGEDYQELEHCYKSTGKHQITLYGDFRFTSLDFSNLNGIYYPLSTIYANGFITSLESEDLNKLIIPLQ